MKKLLQNFDSPLIAVMFILVGLLAVVFLGAGIFQVYIHFSSVIRIALVIGGALLVVAIGIVGYWIRQAVKKERR